MTAYMRRDRREKSFRRHPKKRYKKMKKYDDKEKKAKEKNPVKAENKGLYIVISGPSGSGKSTVIQALLQARPSLVKSVSVTTRPPRGGERDGEHYYFKTLREYQQMIADGAFLETAEVYTNFYGTPKDKILELVGNGADVIGELDTMGARQIKKSYPESVRIFIMPSSFHILHERLKKRGTEDDESLKRRVESARKELSEYHTYDYLVYNDDLEKARDEIFNIISAEKNRIARHEKEIKTMLTI